MKYPNNTNIEEFIPELKNIKGILDKGIQLTESIYI